MEANKKVYFIYKYIDQEIEKIEEKDVGNYSNVLLMAKYGDKYELFSVYNIQKSSPFAGFYYYSVLLADKDVFFKEYLDKWNKNSNIRTFYPQSLALKEFIMKEEEIC